MKGPKALGTILGNSSTNSNLKLRHFSENLKGSYRQNLSLLFNETFLYIYIHFVFLSCYVFLKVMNMKSGSFCAVIYSVWHYIYYIRFELLTHSVWLLFSFSFSLILFFGGVVYWHINLRELFYAKAILVEEQRWYYLNYNWNNKEPIPFPRLLVRKWTHDWSSNSLIPRQPDNFFSPTLNASTTLYIPYFKFSHLCRFTRLILDN